MGVLNENGNYVGRLYINAHKFILFLVVNLNGGGDSLFVGSGIDFSGDRIKFEVVFFSFFDTVGVEKLEGHILFVGVEGESGIGRH